jgi:crotonobetainyl-CoA:carnitine CoA-transferase CaiB-like acyl-CoA transferase/alkylation response protein AidB-like acyl-CoA dehydrogenase
MGPLKGIKVIDMTTVLMGPYATQALGDYGADVIKVESPDGDVTRQIGPTRHPGMGPVFLNTNRSKRSICLDLKKPAGPRGGIAVDQDRGRTGLQCAAAGDGAAAARLRCGGQNQSAAGLCRRVRFRQDGPYAAKPAYDDLIQGATALPALMAQTSADGVPRYVPNALVDRIVGLTAVGAICASLVHRDRTGQGQRVDIPMFETMASFVMGDHMGGLTYDPPLDKGGYARHLSRDRRPYKTADGYICVIVYNDKQWENFFAATGRNDLRQHPKFSTFSARANNIDTVYAELARILETKTTAEWMDILTHADVPVMPMHDLESLLVDPHMVATDRFPWSSIRPKGKIRSMKVSRTGRRQRSRPGAWRRGSASTVPRYLRKQAIRRTRSQPWCATASPGLEANSRDHAMDFALSANQESIRDAVARICSRFDDAYWLKKDKEGGYPADFHMALAEAGWLGICIPEEVWRLGARHHRRRDHDARHLGVRCRHVRRLGRAHERVRAQSGGRVRHQGAVPPHAARNRRRPRPLLLCGDRAQHRAQHHAVEDPRGAQGRQIYRQRPEGLDLDRAGRQQDPAAGAHHAAGGGEDTDAGLSLFYTDFDKQRVTVHEIEKMGRKPVDSNELFFENFEIPVEDRSGEEGRGFEYILHGMNPERILIAAEAVGLGMVALSRASGYAKSRIVFNRPIGMNQAIQHPLAKNWMELEAAWLMVLRAAGNTTRTCPAARAPTPQSISPPKPASSLRAGGDDPWRLRLRQGVSRRALPAGIADPAHRPDLAAAHSQLYRREGAGPAEVVLKGVSDGRTTPLRRSGAMRSIEPGTRDSRCAMRI